jgi:hypothetical protein
MIDSKKGIPAENIWKWMWLLREECNGEFCSKSLP